MSGSAIIWMKEIELKRKCFGIREYIDKSMGLWYNDFGKLIEGCVMHAEIF